MEAQTTNHEQMTASSAPPGQELAPAKQQEKGAIGIAFLVWLFGGGLGLAFLVFLLLKVF